MRGPLSTPPSLSHSLSRRAEPRGAAWSRVARTILPAVGAVELEAGGATRVGHGDPNLLSQDNAGGGQAVVAEQCQAAIHRTP